MLVPSNRPPSYLDSPNAIMISVVIPTLNAASVIGPTLVSLSPAILDPILTEVIISDGGSIDEIAEIADATGAKLITGEASRGRQLAAAAEAARGEWLLFLHADTSLSDNWVEAVRQHIAAGPDNAGWFRLEFDAPGFASGFVAGWANLRSRWLALPYGDQGLLIHRSLYRTVGGHPDIPLMEDVALARALGRRRLKKLNAVARTGADRYVRGGWLRRGARNLLTLVRYFLGASPDALAASYRK